MIRTLFSSISIFICLSAFAQELPGGIEMGKPAATWKADLKDISNPESWDETKFEYGRPLTIYGIEATGTELTFYKDRLFYLRLTTPAGSWGTLRQNLDAAYGKPWSIDTLSQYPSGSWGDPANGVTVYDSASGASVLFSDESQKEFRFTDLFKGMLLWLIVTIVGLFVVYYLVVSIITSWCKGCKTFNMKLQGDVEISRAKDHSAELLNVSMHHDRTYKYKCSKCGSMRKERYSGFWEYQRNK